MAAHPGREVSARSAAAKGKGKTEQPLSQKELAERLALGSPKLVEELWNIAQKQVDIEIARHTRLDTKATSLLTAAGLSLTVAFTFGSTLLTKADAFKHWEKQVVFIFALTVILGLAAAFMAVRALALREQLGVNELAIFDVADLKEADGPEDADEPTLNRGVMEYRKGRILHFWAIRQRYLESYKGKAELVKRGQWAFMAFLAGLLVLCVYEVYAVLFAIGGVK
jgi:hypothetical protein